MYWDLFGTERPNHIRRRVYVAIDSERQYQKQKWGEPKHEIGSFILFMEHHLQEARKAITISDNAGPALDSLRKVTALGVACFEQHGVMPR